MNWLIAFLWLVTGAQPPVPKPISVDASCYARATHCWSAYEPTLQIIQRKHWVMVVNPSLGDYELYIQSLDDQNLIFNASTSELKPVVWIGLEGPVYYAGESSR